MTRLSLRFLGMAASVTFATAAIAVGCGSDDSTGGATTTDSGTADTGSTTGDTGAATTGTLTGTITYSGSLTGVSIEPGLFSSFPPGGPPAYVAHITPAAFPATYTISNVKAGTYYLDVYLSTGSEHTTGPLPDDPQDFDAFPTPITITAGQTTTLPVVLTDPPPSDAGPTDASDDGG